MGHEILSGYPPITSKGRDPSIIVQIGFICLLSGLEGKGILRMVYPLTMTAMGIDNGTMAILDAFKLSTWSGTRVHCLLAHACRVRVQD